MGKRISPDFLIIGAMKAGTTTLYYDLIEHPQIHPAPYKELHYFERNFKKGKQWYRNIFKKCPKNKIMGEASPHYLDNPIVPERAKQFCNDTKFIVCLRNPVDRCRSQFSNYIGQCRRYKKSPITKNVNIFIKNKLKKNPRYNNIVPYCFEKSKYIKHLERWFKYFPKKQFKIIKFEDFIYNPQKILNRIYKFLDISYYNGKLHHRNQTPSQYKGLDRGLKQQLMKYFHPYNKRLYTLLKRDFNWENEI